MNGFISGFLDGISGQYARNKQFEQEQALQAQQQALQAQNYGAFADQLGSLQTPNMRPERQAAFQQLQAMLRSPDPGIQAIAVKSLADLNRSLLQDSERTNVQRNFDDVAYLSPQQKQEAIYNATLGQQTPEYLAQKQAIETQGALARAQGELPLKQQLIDYKTQQAISQKQQTRDIEANTAAEIEKQKALGKDTATANIDLNARIDALEKTKAEAQAAMNALAPVMDKTGKPVKFGVETGGWFPGARKAYAEDIVNDPVFNTIQSAATGAALANLQQTLKGTGPVSEAEQQLNKIATGIDAYKFPSAHNYAKFKERAELADRAIADLRQRAKGQYKQLPTAQDNDLRELYNFYRGRK